VIEIEQILLSLRPSAKWSVINDEIVWHDEVQTQPTQAEIDAERARLELESGGKAYQRKRAAEYPPVADYLDGIVKGDQAQMQTYIDACLAIKAKYPKG
jgi:hypothetical protein